MAEITAGLTAKPVWQTPSIREIPISSDLGRHVTARILHAEGKYSHALAIAKAILAAQEHRLAQGGAEPDLANSRALIAEILHSQLNTDSLERRRSLAQTKLLLVDDDEIIRSTLGELLAAHGFDVTTAPDVPEALKLIVSDVYDVLLSDLHMPGAGDGLTVVSAMRHANPKAVTMLLSAFPEMDAASHAILLQADQILVKPMDATELVKVINERLAGMSTPVRHVETVATILERTTDETINEWYRLIQGDEAVMAISLTFEQRTSHLPQILCDLAFRLRSFKTIGSKELVSSTAAHHGTNRRHQGYSASMLVEESRMLQVSVFNSLQNNLARIDFSILLTEVMTIADEIDSQLSQAMQSYVGSDGAVISQ